MVRHILLVLGLLLCAAAPASAAAPPPFIPITHTTLPLPGTIQPWGPTWTPDGSHILFENQLDYSAWTVAPDGSQLHCLSCQVPAWPSISGNAGEFLYAFPDERRLLVTEDTAWLTFGPQAYVVECTPSIFDCAASNVLPVDMSADTAGSPLVLMRRTWHLAPDGAHIGWTDVRPDGLVMLVAQLVRRADRYVAADPRVIDPPGPSGPLDSDPLHWSAAGEVFELKSFAFGGRDALIVGQPGAANPDQELVDLASGAVTRLTSGPDWDEDGSVSPDGAYLIDASGRTMHTTDALGGMLPELHPFVEGPLGAAIAGYFYSTYSGFQCSLSPWLLPSTGDAGGALLGQPLSTYAGGPAFTSNNLDGQQVWSPDGTRVLLQEQLFGPSTGTGQQAYMGSTPNRLDVAVLGRAPTAPLASRAPRSATGRRRPPPTPRAARCPASSAYAASRRGRRSSRTPGASSAAPAR